MALGSPVLHVRLFPGSREAATAFCLIAKLRKNFLHPKKLREILMALQKGVEFSQEEFGQLVESVGNDIPMNEGYRPRLIKPDDNDPAVFTWHSKLYLNLRLNVIVICGEDEESLGYKAELETLDENGLTETERPAPPPAQGVLF
jgi:hypothetical protein